MLAKVGFLVRYIRLSGIFSAGLLWFCLSACITTPFLKKGQYLLINQRVKGNKSVLNEDLELLFRQKANRKLLGTTPYLGFYFFGKSIRDTGRVWKQIRQKEAYYDAKIKALPPGSFQDSIALEVRKEKKVKKHYLNLAEGNWWMRVVGEPPAIFDSSQARETQREIRKFLFNKGFFHNRVGLETDTFIGGNLAVRYRITEGPRHLVRRVQILTDDYRLNRLVDSARSGMLTRVGQGYSKSDIDLDREYFERVFRDKGYFSFSREYIQVRVDTARIQPRDKSDSLLYWQNPEIFSKYSLDVVFTILNPEEGRHRAYVLTEIQFDLNESDSTSGVVRDTLFNGITYRYKRRKHYSLGILDAKVLLHPNQYFSYSRLTNTQAQLSGMDMFRFVNLNLDTSGGVMRLKIVANRLPKYQSSEELGMLISQGAPGPYANVGLKVRNIFGGFELFDVNVRYSQEGQLSTFLPQDVVFRARDLTITSAFTISKILFPFKLNPRIFEYNPKTRFLFSLSAIKRPEYVRNLIKGALNYTVNFSPTRQLGISPVDVTVNITPEDRLNQEYLRQLEQFSGLGQSVRESFRQSIVTNFNAYYMVNNNTSGQKKKSTYFRVNAEYGGELLYRVLQSLLDQENFAIGKYKLFRYARTSADFRFYNPIRKNSMLAFRISGGVAVPIGGSKILPWEKYAFAGGSNSIRAWLPRRLGPGGFAPANSDPNNLLTEQPGELILESSLELRQKLIGFLEGALFVDAGNVWNLRRDPDRPGAEFSSLFWQQVAFGGGVGLRFDFSFLVVRVDAATKLYNPAFSSASEKWQIRNLSWNRPFGVKGQTLLNVGIGYPF